MKIKILIAIILLGLLAITGCVEVGTSEPTSVKEIGNFNDQLVIYTHCDDGVICYYHPSGYAGGMSCFRDEDLATKYCGVIER